MTTAISPKLVLSIGQTNHPLPVEAIEGNPEAFEIIINGYRRTLLPLPDMSAAGYSLKDVRFVPLDDRTVTQGYSEVIGHLIVKYRANDLPHLKNEGLFEAKFYVLDTNDSGKYVDENHSNRRTPKSKRFALRETVCQVQTQ